MGRGKLRNLSNCDACNQSFIVPSFSLVSASITKSSVEQTSSLPIIVLIHNYHPYFARTSLCVFRRRARSSSASERATIASAASDVI